jgi:uncharacterized protein involved in tellurium resistance
MSEEIKDLIRHALDQDYNKASNVFGEIMSIKMSDLLNQEEIKVANQIYNGVEDTEEEEDGDVVIDDADLDDIEAIEDNEVEEDEEPISDDEDEEEN